MSTSAIQLLGILRKHSLRFFTTADVVILSGMKPSAATHTLSRLASQNLITRIKRGIWVNQLADNLHPYEAVAPLASPWPAYVSLYSTLADAGIIEEIPHIIYAVSSNRPGQYHTSLGHFHIHHLPEHLLWGYTIKQVGHARYPIAEPEKAFLDLVYLALVPRSGLGFPNKRQKKWNLKKDKLKKYAARFKFPPLVDYLKRNVLIEDSIKNMRGSLKGIRTNVPRDKDRV